MIWRWFTRRVPCLFLCQAEQERVYNREGKGMRVPASRGQGKWLSSVTLEAEQVWTKISPGIFELNPSIRYVAVNQGGEIVEMEQKLPSFNPADTDRMEELLVNPTVLDITRRRGELDLEGVRFVLIQYGLQYQAIFNYRDGHVSVGIESDSDAIGIVRQILRHLDLPIASLAPAS